MGVDNDDATGGEHCGEVKGRIVLRAERLPSHIDDRLSNTRGGDFQGQAGRGIDLEGELRNERLHGVIFISLCHGERGEETMEIRGGDVIEHAVRLRRRKDTTDREPRRKFQ